MTDYSDLMDAILSLDAYNRGPDPGLQLSGNTLGSYYLNHISTELQGALASGFVASYYVGLTQNVISYRGTDSLFGDKINGGSGLLNGWTPGAGYSDASQAYGAVRSFIADGLWRSVRAELLVFFLYLRAGRLIWLFSPLPGGLRCVGQTSVQAGSIWELIF